MIRCEDDDEGQWKRRRAIDAVLKSMNSLAAGRRREIDRYERSYKSKRPTSKETWVVWRIKRVRGRASLLVRNGLHATPRNSYWLVPSGLCGRHLDARDRQANMRSALALFSASHA